jgi:hypothetical protein
MTFPSNSPNEGFQCDHAQPATTIPPREIGGIMAVLVKGAVVLAATAALVSGCVLPTSSTGSSSSSGSGSSSGGSQSSVAPAGSAVRDGKFEFQVTNVTRATVAGNPSNEFEIAKAQGEFVILTLSVKNIGDKPQSYFGNNQKLVDQSGRQYGESSEADMWMNSDVTGDINPGNSIQAKAAFDVPPGTVPAHVEFHDSAFSGGVSVGIEAPAAGGGAPAAPTSTSTGW